MNSEIEPSGNIENPGMMRPPALPYLTPEIPPVAGIIKQRPEDFIVEEIPLYLPSGEGTHIYALIEKRGQTTMAAINRIAEALGLRRMDIGFAGRKDSRAVTRQWISIEHVNPDQVAAIAFEDIKVLRVERHNNKLKIGHLSGNQFIIRLRQLSCPAAQAEQIARQVFEILCRRGVPNYFGPQRFGNRFESHLFGLAILQNRIDDFFDLLLGYPETETNKEVVEVRRLYQQGKLEEALSLMPRVLPDHRSALKALIACKGNRKKAFRQIDKSSVSLFLSAWQSDVFNRVLAARMPHIDRLLLGDMAIKHNNGACFRVEDAAVEQPRCDRFEISPTGPLYGQRLTRLTDAAGEIENPILDAMAISDDDLKRLNQFGGRGGRRTLRFCPHNTAIASGKDVRGEYLELAFRLDSGCYATTLLREITKTDMA